MLNNSLKKKMFKMNSDIRYIAIRIFTQNMQGIINAYKSYYC